MPMSSPQMMRMFGLRPDEAAGAVVTVLGVAFSACASAPEVSVAAATRVDVPSNILRRLRALSSARAAFPRGLVSSGIFKLLLHCENWRLFRGFGPLHATESDVARGGIDRLGMTRRGTVAAAIIRRAEVRAALQHLARNPDVRQTGIVTGLFAAAARVLGNAARL